MKPSYTVLAPFTEKQVNSLERWQASNKVHPYTCICGENLIPSPSGWYCNKCEYTQNWCHNFSLEEE